jgi:hypothetical protein
MGRLMTHLDENDGELKSEYRRIRPGQRMKGLRSLR